MRRGWAGSTLEGGETGVAIYSNRKGARDRDRRQRDADRERGQIERQSGQVWIGIGRDREGGRRSTVGGRGSTKAADVEVLATPRGQPPHA
eukprot:2902363-Prymnesium_polylepis.1